MTEKLKEAIDLLSDTLAQVKTEHPYGYNIGTENRYWIEVLPVAIKVLRTVLEAGEKILEVGVSTGIHDELTYGYGKLDEHGFFEVDLSEKEYEAVKAYRQAVLPVVAKKDMIIAEQAKRIETVRAILSQPLDRISEITKEDYGKIRDAILTELNQTVAERGG